MEWFAMLSLFAVSLLAAAIVGGVDDESRGSIERRRVLSKMGYLPLD